jgi:[ribosomal protein S5]-alanine N-acetyltransferase
MKSAITPLQTRRLILEPLSIDDADQIQRIFPHWDVVRYLADRVPWPYPDDGALTYICDMALPAMERGEDWHWTLRLRTDPQRIIGGAGLVVSPVHNRGFWLGTAWQRRGLMSEASDAITDYWFDVLGFDVLRVYKAIDNAGSRRISEKSGMRVIATFEKDYVCGRLPSEQWEITATEWRNRRSQRG